MGICSYDRGKVPRLTARVGLTLALTVFSGAVGSRGGRWEGTAAAATGVGGRYPINCGRGVPLDVMEVEQVTPEPHDKERLVLVQCYLMDGSGDAALFAYGADQGAWVLRQTLIAPRAGLYPRYVGRGKPPLVLHSQRAFSLSVYAYSSASQARAKPDVFAVLSWQWKDGAFHLVTNVPPHEGGSGV